MKTIVVIARPNAWQEALTRGEYTQSTITSTLAEVGFIHCSTLDQTIAIANRHFRNEPELLLVMIDPSKIISPVKFEGALSGRAGLFPHIYGPLNVDAAYKTVAIEKDENGMFVLPEELNNQSSGA